ncbi:MAG: T9SS type A sorting domain-containing protein [Bacteroidales bacterium]|jgi:hypothetical protein|nr:T9SS type A sorting domain-containing protein [Bacteroidales bacterium]
MERNISTYKGALGFNHESFKKVLGAALLLCLPLLTFSQIQRSAQSSLANVFSTNTVANDSEIDKAFNDPGYLSLPDNSTYKPEITVINNSDVRISHLVDRNGVPVNPLITRNTGARFKDGGTQSRFSNIIPDRIDFAEIDSKVYYRLFVSAEDLPKYLPASIIDFENYPRFILLETKEDINKIAQEYRNNGADSVRIINDNNIRIYKTLENLDESDPRENYFLTEPDYKGYYTYVRLEPALYLPLKNRYPEDKPEIKAFRTTNSRHFEKENGEIDAVFTLRPTSYPIMPEGLDVELSELTDRQKEQLKWMELPASYPVPSENNSRAVYIDYFDETFYGHSVYCTNDESNPYVWISSPSDGNYLGTVGAMEDDDFFSGDEHNYNRIHDKFDITSIQDGSDVTAAEYETYLPNIAPFTTGDCDGLISWEEVQPEIKDMWRNITSANNIYSDGSVDYYSDIWYDDVEYGTQYYIASGWPWDKGDLYTGYDCDFNASGLTDVESRLGGNWYVVGVADGDENNQSPSFWEAVATYNYYSNFRISYIPCCLVPDVVTAYANGASSNSVCPGGSVALSVGSFSGGGCACGSWRYAWSNGSAWWNGSSFSSGSPVYNSGYSSINTSVSSSTTFTLRMDCSSGVCSNYTSDNVAVNVYNLSTAASSISGTGAICPGESTVLSVSGGSLGANASWRWYTGSCGGTLVGIGNSITVSPASNTTYYVRAEGTCNTTSCVSKTVSVNTTSVSATSATASPSTITPGNTSTLNVSGGSLGTGANWIWYTGSCGGTLVGTGSSINVSPTVNTTYYVRAEGACNNTSCVSVTVFVEGSVTICVGDVVRLSPDGGFLGTVGESWQWYSGSCGNTYVGAGSSIDVSPGTTTTYYVRSEGFCNTTGCASMQVIVNTLSTAASSISGTNSNICVGGTSTLSVNGGSLGTGASWEWYSGSCGGTYVGSGSSIVVNPGTTTNYYVRAEGSCNTTSCVSYTVNVAPDPSVSINSNATVICTGGSVSFTQTATGGSGSITNQWQYSSDGTSWTNWTTASNPTYNNLTGSMYFRCIRTATNNGCNDGISNTIYVDVTSDPVVNVQPVSPDAICIGGTTNNMTTSANGGTGSFNYQWQYNNGGTWGNVSNGMPSGASYSGASTSTFSASGYSASGVYEYRCLINQSGIGCGQVITNTINVTVEPDPTVSIVGAATICSGGNATLLASESGGAGSYSHQWQSSTDGSSWSNVSGATNSIYTTPSLTSTMYYHVIINASGSGCNSATSNNQTITIVPDPTISTQPSGATICSGQSHTMSVTASDGVGAYSYQWQSYDGSWSNISGATGSSYNASPVLTTQYRCGVTTGGTGCGSGYSNPATVVVESESIPPSNASASPTPICSGESTTLSVELPVTLNGGELDYTTWSVGTGSASGFSRNGADNENYRINGTDPWGNSAVIWEARPDATSGADGGWNSSEFPIDNTKTYRFSVWVRRTNLGNGSFYMGTNGYGSTSGVYNRDNGSNNTNPYFEITNPPAAVNEWILVVGHIWPAGSGTGAENPESGVYTVTEGKIRNLSHRDFVWRAETTSARHRTYLYYSTNTSTRQQWVYPRVDVCDGTEPSINQLLNEYDANDGLGSGASWEWYSGSCGGTSVGSGSSVSVSPASSTTYYVRAEGNCNTTSCESVAVTVDQLSNAGTMSVTNSVICSGGSTTFTASGTTGFQQMQYQWNGTGGSWNDWGNSNPHPWSSTNAGNTLYVRSWADNGSCASDYSSPVSCEVVADPSITSQPVGGTVCSGGSITLSMSATGGTPSLTYQWYKNGSPISGATGTSYNATTSGNYYCIASAAGSGCGSAQTNTVTVTVVADPSITSQPVGGTICSGGSITLSMSATGGTPSLTYQWYRNGSAISGATSTSYSASTTGDYYCIVSAGGSGCGTAQTNTVTVNVELPPTAPTGISGTTTICTGSSTTLTATGGSAGDGCTYQWGTGSSVGSNIISGATGSSYTTPTLTSSTTYWVRRVATSPCSNTTGGVTQLVTVNTNTEITSATAAANPICSSATTSITANGVSGTGASLTWYTGSGGTGSNLGSSNPLTVGPGTYYAYVTGTCGSPAEASVTIASDPLPSASAGGSQTICVNETATVSGASSSYGTIAWTENGAGSITAGSTSLTPTYTPAAGDAGNTVTLTMTVSSNNNCSGETATATYTVIVRDAFTAGAINTTGETLCSGGDPSIIGSASAGTGGDGSITYLWNANGSAISGSNTETYDPPSGLTTTTTYTRWVHDGSCNTSWTQSTGSWPVTIVSDPNVGAPTFTNSVICAGGSTVATSTVSGGTGTLSYQWQYYNGSSWVNVSNGTPTGASYAGASTTSLTITGTTATGSHQYRLHASNSLGCGTYGSGSSYSVDETSDGGTVSANPSTIICAGETVDLSLAGYIGDIQWQTNASGSWQDIPGATSDTYTTDLLPFTTSFRAVVTNGVCGFNTSNTVTVTVTTPDLTGISGNDYIWTGATSATWDGSTTNNWLKFISGSVFEIPAVVPDNSDNVFIRTTGTCFATAPIVNAINVAECNNLTIDPGNTLNINTGSNLKIYGDLINNGTLSVTGTSPIEINGDWINNSTFNSGNGTVSFISSTLQTITSNADSFYKIIFNNSNNGDIDITLVDDLKVTNEAIFTNGIINTSANSFIFGQLCSTNDGNANSFIDGYVLKENCNTSFTFPVGNVNTRDIGEGNQTYRIWAPIKTNPVSTTNISVKYYFSNEDLNPWWYHDWTHESPLTHTSDREYWLVNAGQDLNVTLYWKNNNPCSIHDFCFPGATDFDPSALTIAYWNGIWIDAIGTASANYENGDIVTSTNIPFGAKNETQITFGALTKDMPLPVELIDFDAICENSNALMTWVTASESNNNYFILEKSKDATNWIEIAKIQGAGFSYSEQRYSYLDNSLFTGENYYRLKQVDFDGTETIFKTVNINCDNYKDGEARVLAFPNPFQNNIKIFTENIIDEEITFEIFDELGKLVRTETFERSHNPQYFNINLEHVKSGIYFLRTKTNSHLFNNEIIKQ